jgi:hypothetical protein
LTEFGLLPEPGAIDAYLAAAGSKKNARSITSGYGRSDQDPRPVSFRERLMTEAYLVENTSSITPYVLRTTANPSQGNGDGCSGDSGGPMFCKGARIIPAVVSMGINPQCKDLDFSYRLDRPLVLAWIRDTNRTDAG